MTCRVPLCIVLFSEILQKGTLHSRVLFALNMYYSLFEQIFSTKVDSKYVGMYAIRIPMIIANRNPHVFMYKNI